MPKWSTTERKDYLVKLWAMYGNKCLLGHTACPIPEHYTHYDRKLTYTANPKTVRCIDTSGNPLNDSQGNPLYMTVYEIKRDYILTKRVDRLYEVKSETIIKDWINEDRIERLADYKAETEARHKLNYRTMPLAGTFSGIAQDIYYDNQPQYYLENIGISGLTFKPFAKLRLASSNIRLFVDISALLKPLSKNKKRKAVRYGKASIDFQDRLDITCQKAVNNYLRR